MPRKARLHSEKKVRIALFKQPDHRPLSQSAISEYLSDQYEDLDDLGLQPFSHQFV